MHDPGALRRYAFTIVSYRNTSMTLSLKQRLGVYLFVRTELVDRKVPQIFSAISGNHFAFEITGPLWEKYIQKCDRNLFPTCYPKCPFWPFYVSMKPVKMDHCYKVPFPVHVDHAKLAQPATFNSSLQVEPSRYLA